MKDYKNQSDKELLKLYHDGDQWAFEEITERYKDMVKFHARLFYLTGGDVEDILQEGMIGLFEATNTYRDDRNAAFATFADKCIRSRIIKAVKFDNKKNNQPLNTSLSLELQREKAQEGDKMSFADRLESDSGAGNPENLVLEREMYSFVIERISRELSELEDKVFKLYLDGRSMRDISVETKASYKSVDNAFSRIKTKVKSIRGELFKD